ncbi:MAG: hypothetical protein AAF790_02570 [Planctomycetota bacterium]
MKTRDRVKELRRVRAGDLAAHPNNWRTHPRHQQAALRGVLAEVGYADALVARELPDGTLQLVDGHLRAETTPDAVVPVLVVDLSDAEADKVLLTHDPLSAMAGADAAELATLLERVDTDNRSLNEMLGRLADRSGAIDLESLANRPEVDVPECYQVVVECGNAAEQEAVYERMRKEGYPCRVLTL